MLFPAGCGTEPVIVREPVEVLVPVAVPMTPPSELLLKLDQAVPEFTAPDDPEAAVALTAPEAKKLLQLLAALKAQLDAWTAWATAEGTP